MRNLFRRYRKRDNPVGIADAQPKGIHHTVRLDESYNETWNHIWGEIRKIGITSEEERSFKSEEKFSFNIALVVNPEIKEQRKKETGTALQNCVQLRVDTVSLQPYSVAGAECEETTSQQEMLPETAGAKQEVSVPVLDTHYITAAERVTENGPLASQGTENQLPTYEYSLNDRAAVVHSFYSSTTAYYSPTEESVSHTYDLVNKPSVPRQVEGRLGEKNSTLSFGEKRKHSRKQFTIHPFEKDLYSVDKDLLKRKSAHKNGLNNSSKNRKISATNLLKQSTVNINKKASSHQLVREAMNLPYLNYYSSHRMLESA